MDWTKLYKQYKGLWISLTPDEKGVIYYGKDIKSVYNKSVKKGYKEPILFKVPKKILPFVGGFI